jgi:hypothetical protein
MRSFVASALAFCSVFSTAAAQPRATDYVFLVTADGLRRQELLGGVDPVLMMEESHEKSGIESLESLRREYWSEDPAERREKLLPFFWRELSREGVVLGEARVKNPHHFSYPGYAEILNGQPLESIDSNDSVFSPRETVLEYVKRKRGLSSHQVAAFASWSVFNWITMREEGSIFCNAGYEGLELPRLTEKVRLLERLQFEMRTPWDSVRHDPVTLGLALSYVEAYRPILFYLSLGETDDWAHERRYDRAVQAIRGFDDALRELWTFLQSTEPYRGRTTLVVTTDHGRGRGLDDWTSHGKEVPGSDEIWIGVFGPDTPDRGEVRGVENVFQSNVAATVLELLGLDYRDFNPEADEPIRVALPPSVERNSTKAGASLGADFFGGL